MDGQVAMSRQAMGEDNSRAGAGFIARLDAPAKQDAVGAGYLEFALSADRLAPDPVGAGSAGGRAVDHDRGGGGPVTASVGGSDRLDLLDRLEPCRDFADDGVVRR